MWCASHIYFSSKLLIKQQSLKKNEQNSLFGSSTYMDTNCKTSDIPKITAHTGPVAVVTAAAVLI